MSENDEKQAHEWYFIIYCKCVLIGQCCTNLYRNCFSLFSILFSDTFLNRLWHHTVHVQWLVYGVRKDAIIILAIKFFKTVQCQTLAYIKKSNCSTMSLPVHIYAVCIIYRKSSVYMYIFFLQHPCQRIAL